MADSDPRKRVEFSLTVRRTHAAKEQHAGAALPEFEAGHLKEWS